MNQPQNETTPPQDVAKVSPDTSLSHLPEFSVFSNGRNFIEAQRMAKALCSSSIVPETYRGENRIGDCLIALELANRIGASVLAVMQNLYIVYGRPAWSSQFLISCINASRRFSPIRYTMTGDPNQDNRTCIAWMMDKSGERLESPAVSIAMAKAEGWYQKNGSKWKTMPELMLRYRAATMLARLFAPELTMGIQTDDEVIDIGVVDTSPVVTEPKRPDFGPESSRLLPVTTVQKPDSRKDKAPKTAQDVPGGIGTPADAPKPEEAGVQQQETGKESTVPAENLPAFVPREGVSDELNNILYLCHQHQVTEAQVVAFCQQVRMLNADKGQKALGDMSRAKLVELGKGFGNFLNQIKGK